MTTAIKPMTTTEQTYKYHTNETEWKTLDNFTQYIKNNMTWNVNANKNMQVHVYDDSNALNTHTYTIKLANFWARDLAVNGFAEENGPASKIKFMQIIVNTTSLGTMISTKSNTTGIAKSLSSSIKSAYLSNVNNENSKAKTIAGRFYLIYLRNAQQEANRIPHIKQHVILEPNGLLAEAIPGIISGPLRRFSILMAIDQLVTAMAYLMTSLDSRDENKNNSWVKKHPKEAEEHNSIQWRQSFFK